MGRDAITWKEGIDREEKESQGQILRPSNTEVFREKRVSKRMTSEDSGKTSRVKLS